MSDPTRGGKGKKAPYETQHYRIPTPIRPVVEQLANAYKRLVGYGQDPENLLDGTWKAITSGYYPGDKKDNLEQRITELDNANWEMQKQLTTLDDIAQKRLKKIAELEAEIARLAESVETQKTQLKLFETMTRSQQRLDEVKRYRLHGKEVVRVEDLLSGS